MRRSGHPARVLLAAAALIGSSLLGLTLPVAAQGTPAGTEVPFIDAEGIDHGTIMIRDFAEPFTDFDPAYPPEDGTHYVGMVVVFTASDEESFDANAYGIMLRTVDGHLLYPTFLSRPADAKIPDAQSQTLSPGNRISGFVGFVVPDATSVDEVLYMPDYSRALVVADISAEPGPAAGSTVTVVRNDGTQADVSVTVEDPFTAYAEGYEPEDGMRWIGVTVTFMDSGSMPYGAWPGDIYLRAADGDLYASTWVGRPDGFTIADAESQALSPGDRTTGFQAYSVPTDETIVAVDYAPDGDRRITIADLVGGEVVPVGPEVSPSPAASAGTSQ